MSVGGQASCLNKLEDVIHAEGDKGDFIGYTLFDVSDVEKYKYKYKYKYNTTFRFEALRSADCWQNVYHDVQEGRQKPLPNWRGIADCAQYAPGA